MKMKKASIKEQKGLQESYNSLFEKIGEYARMAKPAIRKMKKDEQDYNSILVRYKETKCKVEEMSEELTNAYSSDSDSSSLDLGESCDGEGNYSAFMAIAHMDSSKDLSILVEELGEHTEVESMRIEEEFDDEDEESIYQGAKGIARIL